MSKKDCIVSTPVTLIPFLQNDDGTRMQMASNQMKQSLDIFHSEHPLVETGLERYYTNKSDLCVVSPKDGRVLYIDKDFICLKLDESEFGISDIKILPTNRYNYHTFCVLGQVVRKGDVLAKVRRFNNKSFKSILNGTNLLTAINSYYGFNYEDAILISESCASKLAHQERVTETISFHANQIPLSLIKDEYEPFLKVGDEIKVGDLLALIKNSDLNNINELISPPFEKRSTCNGIIEKVDVYINNFHESTRELSLFLNKINNANAEKLNDILLNICAVYNANSKKKITVDDIPTHIVNEIQYLTGLTKRTKWKCKNIEVDVLVRYTIFKRSEFNIGDKLANRHGNKGTTPLIVPDKDMFQINGKPVDLIINIMGIPGRMNIGQVYELWAANIVNKVKEMAMMALKDDEEIAKNIIKEFYKDVDISDNKYVYNGINFDKPIKHLISELSFIAPPFDSASVYVLKGLLEKYGVKDELDVYDPSFKGTIKMPLGYMFWEKLHHLSEEKISARSFGGYNKKTMQPLSGKKMKGGQKFGEMEVWAALAYDANVFLDETLHLKSDSIDAKNITLKNLLDTGRANMVKGSSKISEVFKTNLEVLTLDLVDVDEP